MYLKKIELHGFKSFADKVNIEFQPGITGIVGPNGCGKSNISDAVRWVLGEQSVKSLRGSNMADVIFAGSQDRRAQNLAEVTLIFDNSDRMLNYDYNEVEITRRLYRQGNEAEYLLNRQQCRLKDITDLLLDTGLGRDSLSIISQGNISNFADSRPEERRAIFEEAAGVSKYKKRKIEAIRKLERTTDNLNRIKDIVYELEKQIAPLKKQKEKAEVFFVLEEGKEVGFALYFHNFSTFVGRGGIYLEDVYILPEYRGKGYGKAILKKLAAIAVERGCGRMEWVCLDWNQPSIDFYLSLGAQPMSDWTLYRLTGDALAQLAE